MDRRAEPDARAKAENVAVCHAHAAVGDSLAKKGGSYVPWIPTMPPGHSESFEYALVSNANLPSTAILGTSFHVT